MKKLGLVFVLIVLIIGLVYLFQPLIGLNITAGEVFGRDFPFLKSKKPDTLVLPQQFTIKPYIQGLDKPRFMSITEFGDLLVTEPYQGNLLLVPYHKPEQKKVLLTGLNKPHSMAVYEGYLYIAEENAVGRVKFDAQNKQVIGQYEHIINNLPDDGGHWTRTIKFGPDGYGYVSIGSSCNACIEKNPLRATIIRFNPHDNQVKIYAAGLRNAVGFDWSADGKLYATENGRDFLGDDLPPEELNQIQDNHFYGWPYAYGKRIPDPKYGKMRPDLVKESELPIVEFTAHQAPLGITFIKNPQSSLNNKALIAFHGSWNRSKKVGYKVISLSFENGKIIQEDFITGFLKDGKVTGRPVHIVEGKNGELYLSDDYNGIIYLIEEGKP